MARARTINIGLNRVDPAGYHGWDGQLVACEADARDMHALAKAAHIEGPLILTEAATAERVIAEIEKAAAELESGDLLFLTYSGHGGQVPDTGGEEEDGFDETWVLYDRQLIDDELYALWSKFAPDVRIFVLSDSCHSGTVVREFYTEHGLMNGGDAHVKSLPAALREPVYEDHKAVYQAIQKAHRQGDAAPVKAHVLLISGCADNQVSMDGEHNGLFTGMLLQVWDHGAFHGSYRGLHHKIAMKMPPTQSPQLTLAGAPSRAFTRQHPLAV
jgi:metacaspase-1